ncbi:hypothetical protein [Bacillus sp. JCM 19041]|uniref:hypothetical protein n=1 Tax=Bacillus sp. JCM 19041 TaxID=1460637 RepID=UPI0006D098A8
MKINIGSWVIEVDPVMTKTFYNNYHFITDDCDCESCTNYVEACSTYPIELMSFFQLLGIDPCKEELSDFSVDDKRIYSVFYHLIGRIIEAPNSSTQTLVKTHVEVWFSENLDLVPASFPNPTIQLHVEMTNF